MSKRSWTKEEIKNLIERYKLHSELWDVKSVIFKDRIKKKIALKKISNKLNISEQDVQKKIHALRTQFHQELRRAKTKKIGQSKDEVVCESKWEYFNSLKFILTNVESSHSIDNSEEENELFHTKKSEEISKTYFSSIPSNCTKKNVISNRDDEILLSKAMTIMEKPTDEFQIFADYIATEFRLLKSEENKILLRRKIQRAIMEVAELDANFRKNFNMAYNQERSNSSWLSSSNYSSSIPPLQSSEYCSGNQDQSQPVQVSQIEQNNIPVVSLQMCKQEFESGSSMN